MAPPDDELRPKCAASFATLESAVDGFTKAVDEFRSSNQRIDRRVTKLESSIVVCYIISDNIVAGRCKEP